MWCPAPSMAPAVVRTVWRARRQRRLLQFEGLAGFLHFLDWACGLACTRERQAALSYG